MNTQKDNIIFAGDSFTWGQGIQYYSKYDDIKIMPRNQYIKSYLTEEHIGFIKQNRYGKIVSDFFCCDSIIKEENGGSDTESIHFIYNNVNENTKAVILQTTQPIRSEFEFLYKDVAYTITGQELHIDHLEKIKVFKKYLNENNITLDDWYSNLKKSIIEKIVTLSEFLKNLNIPFVLFSWTNEYNDLLCFTDKLKTYLLNIKYDEVNYKTLESLMSVNQEFAIVHNHSYFGDNPPPDWHMSLECHKLVAKNIIEKLNYQLTSQSLNSAAKQSIL